ncbi:MAG: hypothetical protein BJ554DRAFT_5773, partial [Olpidium bornovanus]
PRRAFPRALDLRARGASLFPAYPSPPTSTHSLLLLPPPPAGLPEKPEYPRGRRAAERAEDKKKKKKKKGTEGREPEVERGIAVVFFCRGNHKKKIMVFPFLYGPRKGERERERGGTRIDAARSTGGSGEAGERERERETERERVRSWGGWRRTGGHLPSGGGCLKSNVLEKWVRA